MFSQLLINFFSSNLNSSPYDNQKALDNLIELIENE